MSATLTELDILNDAISPNEGDLTQDVARSMLKWKLTDQAVARMNRLARKNSEGKSTPAEQEELDRFLRVGNLINLVQAKARLSLNRRLLMVTGLFADDGQPKRRRSR